MGWLVFVSAAATAPTTLGQTAKSPPTKPEILLHAARSLDVRAGRYVQDVGILIVGDRIQDVGRYAQVQSHAGTAQAIDLGGATVLPGLIDCHTHLLMQENVQTLLEMSTAERALFGAAIARQAL